ncbi:exodeoxyribonuclease VII small subunit [Lachnoclostridium sp. An14]|uniref:exodeoxyribonuclease VII small subunit n=1 Tax=Lachnoclostridium sp. An14 TaxID=1965562 RepID=UPI000B384CB5|nr:exodeoxyribonuclease VII small subunit [Lachnoclostridium sp. An14]OUQ15234.1 exodeoxyribonuclease VII small subunit [Lachnoclostridium sp. An14]
MSPRKKAGEEAAPEEELSIEETFARLEEVLAHIEEGECSLEETFQYYEKGMKLVKACHDKIDRVEKQIQVLGGEGEES